MENQGWLLKILSGAHQGAEIALDSGVYTMGNNEACDLVLSDPSLRDQHLELSIGQDGIISIRKLSEDISILSDGLPQHTDFKLQPFSIVETAGLHFVVGPENAHWPVLNPNQFSAGTTTGTPQEQDTHVQNSHETPEISNSADTISNKYDKSLDELEIPTLEQFADVKPKKIAFLRKIEEWINYRLITHRNPVLFPAVLISTFIILFVFTFSWLWGKTDPKASDYEKMKALLNDAQLIVQQFPIENMQLKALPDNSILISGYLDNAEEKEKLISELELDEIPHQLKIFTINQILTEANKLLQQLGYKNLKLTEGNRAAGTFTLSGYLAKDHELTNIKSLLRQEVPGLLTIQDQLEYQNTRIKALRAIIKNKGLIDRITLLDQPGKILMKGKLQNVSEGYHFKEAVREFRKLYSEPALEFAVTLPSVDLNTLQPTFGIRSISLGKIPFVVLENGEKYLKGAQLQNGYILDNITLEYLVLRLGTKQIKYHIGGEKNGG